MKYRSATSLVLVISLSALLSACGSKEEREARYIRRGNELFNEKQYDKAKLEYKNAGGIDPTDPEVRYRIGLVDEAQGNLRNAFTNFYHAIEQNGHFKPALLKVAQYYLGAEQYDEAKAQLDVVLGDEPENADAQALLGALSLRRKDYANAERQAKRALAKEPGNVIATSVLTGLYAAQGDKASAEAAVNEGIARNPKEISLLTLKIGMYRKFDDTANVVATYNQIISQNPDEVRYRIELVRYLIEKNQIDAAEASLRKAVKDMPGDQNLQHVLVNFLSEHRGLDAAENELHGLMAANPDKKDIYLWLVDLYVQHKAVDKAVKLLEELVAKDRFEPTGLTARNSLARINFARGDRESAMKLLALVLEKDPTNHDALYMRAGISFDFGQYQSAVSDLRSILRDQPKNKDALQLLAETLLRQGHVDLAIENLNQIVDIDPANIPVKVRLAQMYHLNGDSRRATDLLAWVVKVNPKYAIGWESAARLAIDDKDWSVANDAVAKLAELDGQKMTAKFLQGQVYAGNGKLDEAAREFVDVIKADPLSPLAEHALGAYVEVSKKQGRLEAATHFIETLKVDSPLMATILGDCYAQLGDMAAADKEFEAAIQAQSNRPETYLNGARLALSQEKNPEEAINRLRKGADIIPSDIQIPLMLAQIMGAVGRHQEAIHVYDELLGRNPGLDVAANNMAELIADFEFEDPVALEKARRAAERFQGADNPIFLDTLGWVYLRQGSSDQALATLGKAASSNAAPPQVHYHYGMALLKAGHKDQAKVQLQLATKAPGTYIGLEEAKKTLETL